MIRAMQTVYEGGPKHGEGDRFEHATLIPEEIRVPLPKALQVWFAGTEESRAADPDFYRVGLYRASHRVRRYSLDGAHQLDDMVVYQWKGLVG